MKLLKQERGSITLFVLISMVFFVMYLIGMYILTTNSESSVVAQRARIKEIYEKGIDNIEDVYKTKLALNAPVTYQAYNVGDTVTLNNNGTQETFYVIKQSASNESTLILLAKDAINTQTLKQTATGYDEVDFSSERYWEETDYVFDLNNYPVPSGVSSVITTAKSYGNIFGATGRLLTLNEFEGLQYVISDVIERDYFWWLGTSWKTDPNYPSEVPSGYYGVAFDILAQQGLWGDKNTVRPVIEISKANIQLPNTQTYQAYNVGDTVTLNNNGTQETFYVIKQSSSNESTLTLLAKDAINTQTLKQTATGYDELLFSSERYWEIDKEYDLNNYLIPEGVTSVVTIARDYGNRFGASGRLMTKPEFEAVKSYSWASLGTMDDDVYKWFWLGTTTGYQPTWPQNELWVYAVRTRFWRGFVL